MPILLSRAPLFLVRAASCGLVAFLGLGLWLSAATLRAQGVATTDPLTPAEELAKFHVPPGFEVQLVVSEPAIHKPMNFTFDSRGRLLVTDTVEYPFPAKPGQPMRDTVKVVTIDERDGHATGVTTLVDGLNIPLGIAPVPGGTLVYGIPTICRYSDVGSDGKAQKREEFYSTFGMDDTHGMANSFTRWLDGWVYACHGFKNSSKVQGADTQPISMNSGNTFRMRVDGSHVEQHTWGQVNPFGLCFDPLGNLYSADCHTLPIYQLLRGAYYPSFGKADDGLGFGPTMMAHSHGSSGIGGVAYYAATQFPPAYRDTLFVGNVVTGKVNHDKLESHGSTYKALEQPDFMTCDDPWFHPVYLQVGPDGALYVGDFYNRIIGHYEVPLTHPGRDRERGRIWRVVYTGRGVKDAPATKPASSPGDIDQAPLERLLVLLGHENLTVRTLATHEIVDRIGRAAVGPLNVLLQTGGTNAWQRAHGLWALERLDRLAGPVARRMADDPDRLVRTHIMKCLAERSSWDTDTIELVREKLADSDSFVRRAAVDALARHPHTDNVPLLLAVWSSAPVDDTHLVYTVRMALRDQLRSPTAYKQLARLIESDKQVRERLANVSRGVPTEAAAEFLFASLEGDAQLPERAAALSHVIRYVAADRLPAAFTFAVAARGASADEQRQLVREVRKAAQARGVKLSDDVAAWSSDVARGLLAGTSEADVRAGLELVREVTGLPLYRECRELAALDSKFPAARQAALEACQAIDAAQTIALLDAVVKNTAEPLVLRQFAAQLLARSNTEETRSILARELVTAPESLAQSLAQNLAQTDQGAAALLALVEAGKASPRLLQHRVIATMLANRKVPDAARRIEVLTAKLPPIDAAVKQLIDARRKLVIAGQPDLPAGQAAFKKNCASCHRIGEEGARVGPTLDGVGVRGIERLLEDVLDPNRNVDQAFRTTQIVTAAGTIVSGLVLREEGAVVVLADNQGKEVRVPSAEIEQRSVGSLSLMPGNLAQVIPEPEFVQLVHYLMSQRQKPAEKDAAGK